MHLKPLAVGPVIAITEPEYCSAPAIKGTWAREVIVIALGDSPIILLNGAFFTHELTLSKTKTERSPDTSMRHRLGFHRYFLFPRVFGEIQSIRNDPGVASPVPYDGARHQCNSRR